MFDITTERPEDAAAIEKLLDTAFGANRQSKISYRYRMGVEPVRDLRLVARLKGKVVGALRFWPVEIGPIGMHGAGEPALLLGPLAVDPLLQGRGIGTALMRQGLDMAAWARHGVVLLVGDIGYYARFGFRAASSHGIVVPGENPNRVLARPLSFGAFSGVSGIVRPQGQFRRLVRGCARRGRAIAA